MKLFVTISLSAHVFASIALAQSNIYTFKSGIGGDGYTWPTGLADGDNLSVGDSPYEGRLSFSNEIGNTLMFDNNYLATGNASRIDGPAMWGNPQLVSSSDPYVYIDFSDYFVVDAFDNIVEAADSVRFDIALASSAGNPTFPPNVDQVFIVIYDFDGDIEFLTLSLTEPFNHGIGGSGIGYQDHIQITPFGDLDNIYEMYIYFQDNIVEGFITEFAIDTLVVNSPSNTGSNIFTVDFAGNPMSGVLGAHVLVNSGNLGFPIGVKNSGTEATSFTTSVSSSDGYVYDANPNPHQYAPIAAGQTLANGLEFGFDTNSAPSGFYEGTGTLINNGNSSDPNESIQFILQLFDPAILTSNSGTSIDPNGANQLTISNGPLEGHANAKRASIRVDGLSVNHPLFTVTGIAFNNRIHAGETLEGTVSLSNRAFPSGNYTATVTVDLSMVDNGTGTSILFGSFGATELPSIQWNASTSLSSIANSLVSMGPLTLYESQSLHVSNTTTGAALIGGSSPSAQDVGLAFNDSPPISIRNAITSVNKAVDITFSVASGLYVLEIGYLDADVPSGFVEADLRIYTFNDSTAAWETAITGNSNGGTSPTGAAPFLGSYESYLSALGGEALDATDLGAFGVDSVGNHAWVILDHASLFQLGSTITILPPDVLDISHDPLTSITTIHYQSIAGEVFRVAAGPRPDNLTDLADTPIGDGTIKQYTHTLAPGIERYFYQMRR